MKRTWPYDMWSVGVVWLELLLATPHVFQIAPRTAALLQRHLHLHHKSQVGRSISAVVKSCAQDRAGSEKGKERKSIQQSGCRLSITVSLQQGTANSETTSS